MDISDDDPVFGENTFSLHYRKLSNKDLFSSLEESELGIRNSKNYLPIYETYFNLNETNYNSINLNHRYYVSALSGILDKNNIQGAVVDAFKSTTNSLTIVHKPIFIKFSPLIDPVKYMSGKYEALHANSDILNIPIFSKLEKHGHVKANDRNNAAYVDGFFSYLSSQVLNCHDFIHGLNFYGSFNAIKSEFYYNIIDDIEYLDENPFFNTNKGVLFDVEDVEYYDDSDDESVYASNQNQNENQNENQNGGILNGSYLKDKQKQRYIKNTRNKKPKININKLEDTNNNIFDDIGVITNELDTIFSDDKSSSTDVRELTVTIEHKELQSTTTNIPLMDSVTIDTKNICDLSDIVLNKGSNNKDCSSDDSFTSGSCSSRSSYTTDDSNTGSDCDIDDNNISLDDNMVNVKQHNDREKIKNNYKSKSDNDMKNDRNDSKDRSYNNDDDNDDDNDGYEHDNCAKDNSNDSSDKDGYDDDAEYDDDDDDDDDETLWATIKNFPVSAIMLERCDNTLDSLMMQEKEMTVNEWKSALMQIIMTLITYQKLFGFTHNDLHTNNVMFIYTEKEYIYYHYNKKYYRVPTYNRAFKIIDFGRAIYKYKSKVICSDSFSSTGDAATQYNCEPYFNDKKPRLEPNFSFDLCRLGCSIFDYFIDDMSNVAAICKKDPLAKLIVEWVTDDQNRNILYKANGEERYPDFKLYKMIARNVHNHTPHAQLSKPIFADYEFPKKKVKTNHRIINIDKMPCYMD
jgi:hypothetical protein